MGPAACPGTTSARPREYSTRGMRKGPEGPFRGSGGRICTCDLRVMSRSRASSAGFARCRPIPETRSERAVCGSGVSAVPGRCCRSHESWRPSGTHRSGFDPAGVGARHAAVDRSREAGEPGLNAICCPSGWAASSQATNRRPSRASGFIWRSNGNVLDLEVGSTRRWAPMGRPMRSRAGQPTAGFSVVGSARRRGHPAAPPRAPHARGRRWVDRLPPGHLGVMNWHRVPGASARR